MFNIPQTELLHAGTQQGGLFMSVKGSTNQTVGGSGILKKMMGGFLLVILLSVALLSVFIYMKANSTLETNLKKLTRQMNDQTVLFIDNYLGRFSDQLEVVSSFPDVKAAAGDVAAQGTMLQKFDTFLLGNNKKIMYMYLGTAQKGMYMRPADQLPAGFDPTIRPWYKAAVAADKSVWTDPYNDASTGKLVTTLAKPIKDNGTLKGVMALDVDLSTLSGAMGQTVVGQQGFAFLLDSTNLIMTFPSGMDDSGQRTVDTQMIGKELQDSAILDAIKNKKDNDVLKLNLDLKKLAKITPLAANADDKATAAYNKQKQAEDKLQNLGTCYVTVKYLPQYNWTLVSVVEKKELDSDTGKFMTSIVITGLIALLLAMIFSYMLARGITSPINVMVQKLNRVRDGELNVDFNTNGSDEIALIGHYLTDAFQQLSTLIREIQGIVGEVTASSHNLASTSEETSASAEEVARTVNEIARGASEQAHDAEQGVMIAKNLSEKFADLNDRTKAMIDSAKTVMGANKTGVQTLEGLRGKTRLNDEANDRIEKVIAELDQKTQSIEAILDTISAIAVQTNLLALNASIEAARAGEHGRGFAVVADEIRKLAEGSSKAADEVRIIVTNIQADSTRTVSSMKDVKAISKEQSQAVGEVSSAFQSIFESIEHISGMIGTISGFVNDLNSDKDKIVQSIENISAVSQQTAAASEEVSASMDQQTMAVDEVAKAAERLNEISVDLNRQIGKFKV